MVRVNGMVGNNLLRVNDIVGTILVREVPK